jgi:ribosomal protein S18 acetylase RimI-like enzyme
MAIEIIRANSEHIKDVSILFDLYRQFYKYKKDLINSQNYITDRIINKESIIFLCFYNKKIVGFTQLYETFDSLNLDKKLVLYDLYVLEKYRLLGIGRKLMNASKKFAKDNKYHRIELSTAINNTNAQKLYESLDYIRDKEYYNYDLEIKNE